MAIFGNKKPMKNRIWKSRPSSDKLPRKEEERIKRGAEKFVEKYSDAIIRLAKEDD